MLHATKQAKKSPDQFARLFYLRDNGSVSNGFRLVDGDRRVGAPDSHAEAPGTTEAGHLVDRSWHRRPDRPSAASGSFTANYKSTEQFLYDNNLADDDRVC